MKLDFRGVYRGLRRVMAQHAGGGLEVGCDMGGHYRLEAPAGPAMVKQWGGKMRKPVVAVAWVTLGKIYVSYHLPGILGNPRVLTGYSKELKGRMQGKTCFNFKEVDEDLFEELGRLTGDSLAGMWKGGYIVERPEETGERVRGKGGRKPGKKGKAAGTKALRH